MLKLLAIGLLGAAACCCGFLLNHFVNAPSKSDEAEVKTESKPLQLRTELNGVPIVSGGSVSAYLVFQFNSTVDASLLSSKDFDVAPYVVDAAIRSAYQSTEKGLPKLNGDYFDELSEMVRKEANKRLGKEAVLSVNVEHFNVVPKSEIRNNLLRSNPKK